MEEHPNAALVREMFAAMDRGDVQWLEDHTADDIVWHTGGNSRMAGVLRGKDELRQMMGAAASSGDAVKAEIHDVLAARRRPRGHRFPIDRVTRAAAVSTETSSSPRVPRQQRLPARLSGVFAAPPRSEVC